MIAATNGLKRIDKALARLRKKLLIKTDEEYASDVAMVGALRIQLDACIADFETAMCDDLNTSRAFSALFKWVTLAEKHSDEASIDAVEALLHVFEQMNYVLGIDYDVPMLKTTSSGPSTLSTDDQLAKATELANKRMHSKSVRDFAAADSLRQEILTLGYGIRDTKDTFELYAL